MMHGGKQWNLVQLNPCFAGGIYAGMISRQQLVAAEDEAGDSQEGGLRQKYAQATVGCILLFWKWSTIYSSYTPVLLLNMHLPALQSKKDKPVLRQSGESWYGGTGMLVENIKQTTLNLTRLLLQSYVGLLCA